MTLHCAATALQSPRVVCDHPMWELKIRWFWSAHACPHRSKQLRVECLCYMELICIYFLISNFRRVLNIVCVLLGISLASDCDLPTFRNPLSVPSSKAGCTQYSTPSLWRWNWQRVPKRWKITIWHRENTQKNTYNVFIYFQTNLSSQQSLTQEFSQWTVTGILSEALVTSKNMWCVTKSEAKVQVPSFILNWNVAESKKLICNLKFTSFSNQKKGKWTLIIQIDVLVVLYTKQFAFSCYCQIWLVLICLCPLNQI
jgi:hypothetical protein